ncbi:uncharacterized protein [Euwallacea similis]|uniref:uncharacterized protein n=1 Tax=Euwallacea similis TaxID=1736056 RepID=UPI00344DCDC2
MSVLKYHRYYSALLIIAISSEVCCSNITGSYLTLNSGSTKAYGVRHSRLINFNADGDLQLDLDFNVPFLTLPIKRSMDMAKTSLVNFNVGAILLAGVIIFGAAVALPVILMFFNKKGLVPAENPLNIMYGRIGAQKSEDSRLWNYLNAIDTSLLENNIDLTSCSQRFACWMVKKSTQNVTRGKGSSSEKILDGLANSKWIQEYALNPLFKEAIINGIEDKNCTAIYARCRLNHETVYYFIKRSLDTFNIG